MGLGAVDDVSLDEARAAALIARTQRRNRIDPKAARAYTNRAFAYLGKGDWERAAADGTETLGLAPTDGSSCYVRAVARFRRGQYAGAADDFGAALRLTPPRETTWKAYLHLCRACARAYQHDPARAAADLAVAVILDRRVFLCFRVWYTGHWGFQFYAERAGSSVR